MLLKILHGGGSVRNHPIERELARSDPGVGILDAEFRKILRW